MWASTQYFPKSVQILLTIVYMFAYITIPRFAEISLKTVGIIPLGLVITISFVCIAFYQYLRNLFDLEICICHYH